MDGKKATLFSSQLLPEAVNKKINLKHVTRRFDVSHIIIKHYVKLSFKHNCLESASQP